MDAPGDLSGSYYTIDVLEPGSGEFGFIICDMEGNVIEVHVEGVWPRLSLLKMV